MRTIPSTAAAPLGRRRFGAPGTASVPGAAAPAPGTASVPGAVARALSVQDTPIAARRNGVSWTLKPQHLGSPA